MVNGGKFSWSTFFWVLAATWSSIFFSSVIILYDAHHLTVGLELRLTVVVKPGHLTRIEFFFINTGDGINGNIFEMLPVMPLSPLMLSSILSAFFVVYLLFVI